MTDKNEKTEKPEKPEKKVEKAVEKSAVLEEEKNLLHYLDSVIRHIQNVQENGIILGKRLIEKGEKRLGKMLIYHVFQHDVSKFIGIEWDYLNTDLNGRTNKEQRANFTSALKQHQESNMHHPEFWEGIHNMPDVHLAEMVCDWKARSSEFGTDIRAWIHDEATKKYGFKMDEDVGKKITKYVDLLCNPSFGKV